MQKKKLFLASSSELSGDRKEFEILIGRKNKDWVSKGVFFELIVWEDFLDALSQTRLQDEYNKAIRECDIFVMLFFTKVGKYTEEEFETAFGQFKDTNKPFIFTYFKDAEISTGSANRNDLTSLWAFQDKLKALGHFQTVYKNTEGLLLHFGQQLDKLAANDFIEFKPEKGDATASRGHAYHANVTGSGAIAQGPGSTAVGAGGVWVGRDNTGSINTGTQVDTGGGDLEPLFAPLLAAVAREAPPDKQAAAVQQVQELKAEVAKGKQADDGRMAKLVDGLVGLVPKAVGAILSTFATPILGGIAGPVTKYVLEKLKGS